MSREEQAEKHQRVKKLLATKGLDAIVLRKGANIAWFIGGRAHVPTTLELACLDLIIYPDRIVVVTNKIEAERLKAEELSGVEELIVVNWFEDRGAQLRNGPSAAQHRRTQRRTDGRNRQTARAHRGRRRCAERVR